MDDFIDLAIPSARDKFDLPSAGGEIAGPGRVAAIGRGGEFERRIAEFVRRPGQAGRDRQPRDHGAAGVEEPRFEFRAAGRPAQIDSGFPAHGGLRLGFAQDLVVLEAAFIGMVVAQAGPAIEREVDEGAVDRENHAEERQHAEQHRAPGYGAAGGHFSGPRKIESYCARLRVFQSVRTKRMSVVSPFSRSRGADTNSR